MSVIVVGLNHRTAPVEMRERVAVPASRQVKAVHDLAMREHLAEVVLLSTCNRTEIYARCTKFHAAVSDILEFLAEQASAAPEDFSEHLYTYYDDGAVAHLFGVTAGLDSMIIGEGEILGQVRDAWQLAEQEQASGQLLNRVFRQAVVVGKRARTETAIGRQALSISSAAVALAEQTMFSLRGRSVLVLGAGEVAQGLARALVSAGVGEVVVANRTYARAVELANKVGGRPVSLGELPEVLSSVDVLLTATDSTEVHVERGDIEAVMERRDGAALLVVDVAVPRDVDPGARQVPAVTLLDMDDLKRFTERSLEGRRREVGRVQGIIMDELERFQTDRTAREMAPILTSLRQRADAIRVAELERFRAKLNGLPPETRNAVEALTLGIVNKLLHEPTVRLKDAAGTARGELYADALGALFDLPDGFADEPTEE
ncbi:MAG TPA: glutamyl-tRNA reductase [Acidimicrobiia bacterium]